MYIQTECFLVNSNNVCCHSNNYLLQLTKLQGCIKTILPAFSLLDQPNFRSLSGRNLHSKMISDLLRTSIAR